MDIAPVHRNAERTFKGTRIKIASLSAGEKTQLLGRFSRTKRLKVGLERWLEGSVPNLPFTANEYNHYLKSPLNGRYYRFFSHLDKVDRLWEITPERNSDE